MVIWPSLSWQRLHSVMSALASLVQHIAQVVLIWRLVKTVSTGKTMNVIQELEFGTNTVLVIITTTDVCLEECKACQDMGQVSIQPMIGGKNGN